MAILNEYLMRETVKELKEDKEFLKADKKVSRYDKFRDFVKDAQIVTGVTAGVGVAIAVPTAVYLTGNPELSNSLVGEILGGGVGLATAGVVGVGLTQKFLNQDDGVTYPKCYAKDIQTINQKLEETYIQKEHNFGNFGFNQKDYRDCIKDYDSQFGFDYRDFDIDDDIAEM